MVAIGADHGGFELKESIKKYFDDCGIGYIDLGTYSDESVDYPVFTRKVASAVADRSSDYGILCCGTGIGVSIAANKVRGIRAALCYDEYCAKLSRQHNDANVLCLGGRVLSKEAAINVVCAFLGTNFEGGRHANRVRQISEIECS